MSSEGEIILSYHDALLRKSDMALLEGSHWLNDSVLAFWFEYLEKDLFRDCTSDITFISPQVSQFLKLCGPQEVQILLEPLKLPTKKLILLPVNDCESENAPGGSHWSLLVFDQSEGFRHYDSTSGSMNDSHARRIANVLAHHLKFNQSEKPFQEAKCTSQLNSYDCGIHVLCNSEAVCQGFLASKKCLLKIDPKSKRKDILDTIYSLRKQQN